jgi:hypothetical protein
MLLKTPHIHPTQIPSFMANIQSPKRITLNPHKKRKWSWRLFGLVHLDNFKLFSLRDWRNFRCFFGFLLKTLWLNIATGTAASKQKSRGLWSVVETAATTSPASYSVSQND